MFFLNREQIRDLGIDNFDLKIIRPLHPYRLNCPNRPNFRNIRDKE
jgi:hypothetical protein